MNTLTYFVYVLQSAKDRMLYVGRTNNLERRLSQHEAGESKSTSPRRPYRLLHYEAFLKEADAERREHYLKSTVGRRMLKLILRDTLRDY